MTPRTTMVVTVFALATSACTGNSHAVDIPGATSTDAPRTTPAASTTPPTTTVAPTPETTTTTTEPPTPTTTAPPPTVDTAPPPTEPAPAPTSGRNPNFLREGDEGPRVAVIQFKLVALDYLPTGADTGVFDSATNRAVLRFQGDYGLIVDGVIGPETERAISAAAESIDPEQN